MQVHLPKAWLAFLPPGEEDPAQAGAVRFTITGGAQGLHLFCGPYEQRQFQGVHTYHLPGDAAWAQEVAQAATFGVERLTQWLGPRPLPDAQVVVLALPAGWGSQHLPGLIAQTSAEDGQARMAEVVHEVAHFWTPGRDANRFCDEAVAHYLEDLLVGERDGVTARVAAIAHRMRALGACPEAQRVPLAAAAGHAALETVSRQKGPLALCVLEYGIGRDGVLALLKSWIRSPDVDTADAGRFVRHAGEMLAGLGGFDGRSYLRDWFEAEAGPPLDVEGDPEEALCRAASRYTGGQTMGRVKKCRP